MLVKNSLPWDLGIALCDWRFQRVCRVFCVLGIHVARVGKLRGGFVNCAHCGTVLVG